MDQLKVTVEDIQDAVRRCFRDHHEAEDPTTVPVAIPMFRFAIPAHVREATSRWSGHLEHESLLTNLHQLYRAVRSDEPSHRARLLGAEVAFIANSDRTAFTLVDLTGEIVKVPMEGLCVAHWRYYDKWTGKFSRRLPR